MLHRKGLQDGSCEKGRASYLGIVLTVLALALVISCVPVKSSSAYFTAYTTAAGGIEFNYVHRDEFHEEVDGLEKTLTVKNDGSGDVFARIKAVAPKSFTLTFSGANWTEGSDGFWYYTLPVAPGESTGELKITIDPGDYEGDFEVTVAEETVPALYREDGTAYADWNGGANG